MTHLSTCPTCGGTAIGEYCPKCDPEVSVDALGGPRRGPGRPRLPDAKTPYTHRASPQRWADLDRRAEAAGLDRRALVDELLWPDAEEPDCRPDDDADYGAAEVASALDAGERRGGR